MNAKFVQRADSVDFIPDCNIDSGKIVRLGNLIGVTKMPIRAGELGAIALSGIFDFLKPTGLVFPLGSPVYWNSGAVGQSGDVLLGITVKAAAAESATVRILLNYSENQSATSSGDDCRWRTL